MTKKKQHPVATVVTEAGKSLSASVSQMAAEGYVSLPVRQVFSNKNESDYGTHWKDVFNTALGGGPDHRANPAAVSPVGQEVVVADAGTPGRGYISWGPNNNLPNTIALLVSLLPYTAAGVKFNTDITAGLGPVPKFRYSHYSNGTVVTESIDYESAGVFLEGQLLDRRKELADYYATQRPKGSTVLGESSESKKLQQQIESQLKQAVADAELAYTTWKKTADGVGQFRQDNNLDLVCTELANDMSHLGICFPEIVLDRQGENKNDATWRPKAIGLKYRSSCVSRLERMDDHNRINYVYVSNQWLDKQVTSTSADSSIAAIPALDPHRPLLSLKEKVADHRIKAYNGRTSRSGKSVSEHRPTRFILPSFYPSLGRPYYPQPMWHSVLFGDIYSYISTIIENRAIAKANSNMAGKIIYIHTEYLGKLYMQEKAENAKEKAALRDQMWDEINTFLRDRSNNGQTILSFTFIGSDGKEHDAWRIVDVPLNSKAEAEANKTELLELSSIIFFALNIHPDLIGAVPGSQGGSSGGTYQRELYEMKKLMMAPTQRLILKALDVIRDFNEWDSHLTWEIKQMTLTTLDRNKNGMEETKV